MRAFRKSTRSERTKRPRPRDEDGGERQPVMTAMILNTAVDVER